ncbi:MAG: carboxypeptidase-like regulatory domain-containing protein [Bacteroidales bacterium]|nr:carboxypeptidase-like regulatory domain-containing protein [Bacteroidales bacterium]
MKRLIAYLTGMLVSLGLLAAAPDSLRLAYSVSGTVTDARSGRPIESAHVFLLDRHFATVTNAEGYFVLKSTAPVVTFSVSCIGYATATVAATGDGLRIALVPETKMLDPASVLSGDPERIVREAVSRIPYNYSTKPELMESFYRETIRKRQRFIYISEAVAKLYKTSYMEGVYRDRASLSKSRILLSQRRGDTLSVKMMGGPTQALVLDAVKNDEFILGKPSLEQYNFRMEPSVSIGGAPHFVISMTPVPGVQQPMYYGKLFIDAERLSFTRMELTLDMSDPARVTPLILVKRPPGMRFSPKELSLVLNYRTEGGVTRLSYLKTVIRFRCDMKKRLFSTNYTVVNELAVTGLLEPAVQIPRAEMFRVEDILEDKAALFMDEEFWKDYIIIEPTESLENAIGRLRK